MASGHVKPHQQAEHMAAPTNAANLKKALANSGAVHTWHEAADCGAATFTADIEGRTDMSRAWRDG